MVVEITTREGAGVMPSYQMQGSLSQADAVDARVKGHDERPTVVTDGVGSHQYYRQPDGTIKMAFVGKIRDGEGAEERKYRARGWTPLPQYGRYFFNEWQIEHPLEGLFMAGGAHEVSIEQIRANGWDKRPPEIPWCNTPEGSAHLAKYKDLEHGDRCFQHMITVEFPQMAGQSVDPVEPCEFCDRDDLPTARARKQHIYIMHKEEIAQIRMGEVIAATLTASTKQMIKTDKYVCGDCGEGFSAINKLGEHVKIHTETTE